jgi:hypothetical protein
MGAASNPGWRLERPRVNDARTPPRVDAQLPRLQYRPERYWKTEQVHE